MCIAFKRGFGGAARVWRNVARRQCKLRIVWVYRSGEHMRGGLRWPFRPFQVTCVLVVVLLTAAFSLPSASAENVRHQPLPEKPNLGRLRAQLNATTSTSIHPFPVRAERGDARAARVALFRLAGIRSLGQ
jgi:hypothetical protein